MAERKNRMVFWDPVVVQQKREADLGRKLTPVEDRVLGEADAIKIDALACGRSVKTTVENIEKGGGNVSDAVKALLGLIPPVN